MSKRMIAFVAWALLLTSLFLTTLWVFEVAATGPELHWQKASYALEPGRYAHTLIESRGNLYILGGRETYVPSNPTQGLPIKTILCSQIVGRSGDISPWRQATTLMKTAVSDAAIVAVQYYIYIIGGRDASGSPINTVQVVQNDLCDQIQGWQQEEPVELPKLEKSAAVYYDGVIYIVGGRDENYVIHDETYSAVITTPGQLPGWNIPNQDGPALFNHALFAANDYLYVVGGVSSSGTQQHMYRAKIISPGLISGWVTLPITNSLLAPLSTLRAVVANNRAYVIGGHNSGVFTDQVWSAELHADGSVEPWTLENKLPRVINWHSAVLASNGSIYVTGGLTDLEQLQPSTFYIPPLSLTKSNDPTGPVHEGDIITYTISYANTGLVSQSNIVITDRIPAETELITTSLYNADYNEGSELITWPASGTISSLAVGESAVISFQVQVPLLPPTPPNANPPPPLTVTPIFSGPSAAPISRTLPQPVEPHPVTCHSTTFWMAGISDQQPNPPIPFSISITIPPNSTPSYLWVIAKKNATLSSIDGITPPPPIIFGGSLEALLWRIPLDDTMLGDNQLGLQTNTPDLLSAILLYEGGTAPFSVGNLDTRLASTQSYTYSLRAEFPNAPVEVELPIIDVRFWDLEPNPDIDTRVTTVTVQVEDQGSVLAFMHPNAGNGLRLESFEFNNLSAGVHTLYITVDTEDSLYFLSPHICRSPFVINTAYICSDQVGCLSATAINNGGGIYLPIILKSSTS